MAFDFITAALNQRRSDGLLRSRQVVDSASGPIIEVAGQHYLNFSSNDYLAMRRSAVVAQAWVDGISEFGGGSGASPLVTGYTNAHQALEEHLASTLQRGKVLLFNSGFAANQAVCQALFAHNTQQHRDVILADKLMHASFIEGAQASNAKLTRFRHNDLNHLQALLASQPSENKTDVLVATEGVFSMDGDQAPLAAITDICTNANAWLMVDDAHGFGALGDNGLGVVDTQNLSQSDAPILMATFGKAVGTAGAFVAGSEDFIDYLINFARHYIYSTAMPAAQAYATLVSLQSKESATRRQVLRQRIEQFKTLTQAAGIGVMPSDTAIQPIVVGDAEQTVKISEKLKSLGLWVTAIRYPTVPKKSDRLRITLSAGHDEKDIQALVDALQMILPRSSTLPEAKC